MTGGEAKMITWMQSKGMTSDKMYKVAAAHVVGAALLWIKAESSGDATAQRRAIALSLCPPIYQLWGLALRHEEAKG
jgi:hypothetical protein